MAVFVVRNDALFERVRQRVPVQIGNVVPLQVGFDQQLPVGVLDHTVLAVAGESLQTEVVEVISDGSQILFQVYFSARRWVNPDQPGALCDGKFHQPEVVPVHFREVVGLGDAFEAAVQSVSPTVERTDEGLEARLFPRHEPRPPVPAGIEEGAQATIGISDDHIGEAGPVTQQVGAGFTRAARVPDEHGVVAEHALHFCREDVRVRVDVHGQLNHSAQHLLVAPRFAQRLQPAKDVHLGALAHGRLLRFGNQPAGTTVPWARAHSLRVSPSSA